MYMYMLYLYIHTCVYIEWRRGKFVVYLMIPIRSSFSVFSVRLWQVG